MQVITIAAGALALLALIVWFHALEVRNNRHVIFVTLVLTLVVEALLAGPASEVPIGLLRPQIGGQDFRPPDIIIVAAVVVRAAQVRLESIQRLAIAWGAFVAFYMVGTVAGIMRGYDAITVLFVAKSMFYIVGGMMIASGADLRRCYDGIGRLSIVLSFLVPIAFVIKTADINISFSTPVQRFNRLGRLSNDSISLVALAGAVAMLVEVTRHHRRWKVGVAGLVLMLAPVVGRQRASYVVVASSFVVLTLLVLGRTWRRRSQASGTEIGLFAMGFVAFGLAGFVFTASPATLVEPVVDAFGGERQVASASARVDSFQQAVDVIQTNPLTGFGVGTKVTRLNTRSNQLETASAHNLFLDIGMQIGLFGVALLLMALWSTTHHAVRLWRQSDDTVLATMAVAGFLLVAGVFTKGMVEPALEKFRLALSMGIGVGLLMAAQRAEDRATAKPRGSARARTDGLSLTSGDPPA